MTNIGRQVVAICAFIIFGPMLMITSLENADIVNYELKEVKEKDVED